MIKLQVAIRRVASQFVLHCFPKYKIASDIYNIKIKHVRNPKLNALRGVPDNKRIPKTRNAKKSL